MQLGPGNESPSRAALRRLETFRPTRHARGPRWSGRLAAALRAVAIALVVVLVSTASVTALFVWQLGSTVTENAVDISNGDDTVIVPPPTIGEFEGGFNILAVGADNSEDQPEAFGARGATLNDVNILVHVAADHKTAVVLSLPRDLVIAQPKCTDPVTGNTFSAVSARPLNEAYQRGGLGCVNATVEALTGLDIPYAALFTFQGTVAMSDAVGGVPICLDAAIFDPYSGLDLPEGINIVSGQQALAYLRTRKGVGDGGDLSRISSQQAYMSSMMRVMKSSETLTDVTKVVGLANAAVNNVSLSTSLADLNTMVSMALSLKDVDLNALTFVTYPSVTDPNNVNKLVPATTIAAELMTKIATDESFVLDDAALGNGVTIDPNAPVVETPTAEPTDGAVAGPEVLAGVRGQTADQQTCSVASGF